MLTLWIVLMIIFGCIYIWSSVKIDSYKNGDEISGYLCATKIISNFSMFISAFMTGSELRLLT